jgi:hypothetical protein
MVIVEQSMLRVIANKFLILILVLEYNCLWYFKKYHLLYKMRVIQGLINSNNLSRTYEYNTEK